jgi:hypothetical protein
VDADSQCNLTNIFVGEDYFEQLYIDHPDRVSVKFVGSVSWGADSRRSPSRPAR